MNNLQGNNLGVLLGILSVLSILIVIDIKFVIRYLFLLFMGLLFGYFMAIHTLTSNRYKFRICCFKCRKEIIQYPFMIKGNQIFCYECGYKDERKILYTTKHGCPGIKDK